MNKKRIVILVLMFLIVSMLPAIGIKDELSYIRESYDGYTLFSPMASTTTYLINNDGDVVHTWVSNYKPRLSVYLLENLNLLRTNFLGNNSVFVAAGASGRVELLSWNGTVIWDFEYSSNQYCTHHDIEMLPNGNIFMIAWEYKSATEGLAAGRDPLVSNIPIWPDHVIEVEPTGDSGGNIVWEWHVWDHLIQDYDPSKDNFGVVSDHPELIDINFAGGREFNHINSIDYNEELDQILLSVNKFNEIWVIDHSTTTAEAASHTGGNIGKGGDILYRWGNPRTYDTGNVGDQKFFNNHDAQWIESGCPGEGNFLVFNNGMNRPDVDYSSVDEIVPPIDENGNYIYTPGSAYGPDEQVWIYTSENLTDFFSSGISGAQRLPNGNTAICEGNSGTFFEVTPDGLTVWEYVNPYPSPGSNVFKIRRYNLLFNPLITDLSSYWNFISLPFINSVNKTNLIVHNDGTDYSWSNAITEGFVSDFIFGWSRNGQNYNFENTIEPGFGYWFYLSVPCELRAENITITPDDYITDLEQGWNIVGVPHDQPVNKTDILVDDSSWDDAVTAGCINDFVFGWSRTGQSYYFADMLMPGYAYWVYAYQSCTLKRL